MNLLVIYTALWLVPVLMLAIYAVLKKYVITYNIKKNMKQENINQIIVSDVNQEHKNTIPFNKELAQVIFSKKIKENDLKIVAGINPKIEGLFHVFGIKTWKDLGETSVEKCQKILKSVGNRYKLQKPKTWPKQAKLASEGKWEELEQWQAELTAVK